MKSSKTLGIVGITGVVGQTVLDLLQTESFKFSVEKIKAYASHNSVGKVVSFNGKNVAIEVPNVKSLSECDAVIFASDSSVSKKFIPLLAKKGIYCIDKSSAFRMDPKVPLVVPEVNASQIKQSDGSYSRIIASPNCVAIPLVSVVHVLHTKFKLLKLAISTYQSVSGTGKAGMDILLKETKEFFHAHDLSCSKSLVYPKSIAFNVMPFVESIDENGNTGEETKIRDETKKILNAPSLLIDVTSVRVPTFVGHGMSVVCETEDSFTEDEFLNVLKAVKGIKVSKKSHFTTPRETQGTNEVFVSRIRKSNIFSNGLSLWIVCDNLRKGAALNALQIVETVFTKKC